ncbi:MAG: DUF1294 domain-containing protein [Clostridiaceae bacterium]|nr:DUF1294 domain-containing protein [Clostridiaceae bacterium]
MQYLAIYLGAINILSFILCGADKLKAKKGWWRVPERTLFITSALGGSVGMLLGMSLFRHKTKHRSFTIGIPTILAFQLLAAALIFMKYGR